MNLLRILIVGILIFKWTGAKTGLNFSKSGQGVPIRPHIRQCHMIINLKLVINQTFAFAATLLSSLSWSFSLNSLKFLHKDVAHPPTSPFSFDENPFV